MSLEDAVELWRELTKSLRPQDYDTDLADVIRGELQLDANLPMSKALDGVSAEALIDAIFRAVAPYAGMMTDLLSLYESVGAQTGDGENLRIRYAFDEDQEPLEFDVTAFREWEEASRIVRTPRATRVWDQGPAWQVVRTLRGDDHIPPARSTAMVWPATGSPSPHSGFGDADQLVADIWVLRDSFLVDAEHEWPKRADYRRAITDGKFGQMALMVSDRWDDSIREACERFVDQVAQLANLDAFAVTDEAGTLTRSVRTEVERQLAELPIVSVEVEDLAKVLLAVLALPTWGKRHEIYSAWIFAQIVEAIGLERMIVIVTNGKLSFDFSGNHLATVATQRGPMEIWAELRTAHLSPKGKGRTRAIQPDYSLTLRPVHEPSTTILAVECKQYRQSALRNPADAVDDYTSGLPDANVVLATYGPVSQKVLDGLDLEQRSRASVVRELRPGHGEKITEFHSQVLTPLPPLSNIVVAPEDEAGEGAPQPRGLIEVELSWSDPESDLDLWAQIDDGPHDEVSYKHRSTLVPGGGGILLSEDVTAGPGRERLVITGSVRVTIRVHAFKSSARWQIGASLSVNVKGAMTRLPIRADALRPQGSIWRGVVIEGDDLKVIDDYED